MRAWIGRCLLLVGLVGLGGAAHASAPMSVWATLDVVTIVVSKAAPPRLVLEGTFKAREGGGPVAGRLVYSCADDTTLAQCLSAWSDLATAAQAGACVGWGQPSTKAPSPAPLGDAPPAAVAWPLGQGVARSSWQCR